MGLGNGMRMGDGHLEDREESMTTVRALEAGKASARKGCVA